MAPGDSSVKDTVAEVSSLSDLDNGRAAINRKTEVRIEVGCGEPQCGKAGAPRVAQGTEEALDLKRTNKPNVKIPDQRWRQSSTHTGRWRQISNWELFSSFKEPKFGSSNHVSQGITA